MDKLEVPMNHSFQLDGNFHLAKTLSRVSATPFTKFSTVPCKWQVLHKCLWTENPWNQRLHALIRVYVKSAMCGPSWLFKKPDE